MRRWNESDTARLKAMYGSKTAGEIAAALGMTENAVRRKAHSLGLRKSQPTKIRLTDEQRRWLTRNFPHVASEICASILGISLRSVTRQARALGLEKTAQFMKESQAHTAMKAKESHLRNGTYPAKGWYSPNLQKGERYQFKPRRP